MTEFSATGTEELLGSPRNACGLERGTDILIQEHTEDQIKSDMATIYEQVNLNLPRPL